MDKCPVTNGYSEIKACFSCRLHLQSKVRVRVGLGNS